MACDAIARFQRLEGSEVTFITGVDEHGLKIQRTAESKNKQPKEHCDLVSTEYKDLWNKWNISNDVFIRTTESTHINVVYNFFNKVVNSNDIYMGQQKGWYCVGCEEFKEIKDTTEEPFCTTHKKKLEWRDEENLFFRLSKYQLVIEELINKEGFIEPKSRKNEIKQFVSKGLKDFSISRVNLKWGIPVPGYDGHTFYVWFDALLGYISAICKKFEKTDLDELTSLGWPPNLHVIGKDIIRFHAIYWPAMLMSAGLPIPKKVFGHGFLTKDGIKMGKSIGNIIDPDKIITQYGIDSVRWYLLKDFNFGYDGDFQYKRFKEIVNNDLANVIGNLLNRAVSMSRKWFDNSVPDTYNSENHSLAIKSIKVINEYKAAMYDLEIQSAIEKIIELATYANCLLNERAPWKAIKNPEKFEDVCDDIYSILETNRIIGLLLRPIVPNLSKKILLQLGCKEELINWNRSLSWGIIKSSSILPQPIPIMDKIEFIEGN